MASPGSAPRELLHHGIAHLIGVLLVDASSGEDLIESLYRIEQMARFVEVDCAWACVQSSSSWRCRGIT